MSGEVKNNFIQDVFSSTRQRDVFIDLRNEDQAAARDFFERSSNNSDLKQRVESLSTFQRHAMDNKNPSNGTRIPACLGFSSCLPSLGVIPVDDE
mmetsp:Transcript_741/g.1188  ORF Transcript_741/g.1188 Transcript_741/m.1188 type:complete len:95 (+) Transcript_741:182-466(+)